MKIVQPDIVSTVFGAILLVASAGCLENQTWQTFSISDVGEDVTEEAGKDIGPSKDLSSDLHDTSSTCAQDCAASQMVCDPSDQTCKTCLDDNDCDSGLCLEKNACVECVQSSDCTETGLPLCKDNVCFACQSDDDCGGDTCDQRPDTKGNCVSERPKDLGLCVECYSDNECATGSSCVMTSFGDSYKKSFCLLTVSATEPCNSPFTKSMEAETSLNGKSTFVCWPEPTRSTCDAYLAHVRSVDCATDTDCPTAGLCRVSGMGMKCSYACFSWENEDLSECASGCSAPDNSKGYCL